MNLKNYEAGRDIIREQRNVSHNIHSLSEADVLQVTDSRYANLVSSLLNATESEQFSESTDMLTLFSRFSLEAPSQLGSPEVEMIVRGSYSLVDRNKDLLKREILGVKVPVEICTRLVNTDTIYNIARIALPGLQIHGLEQGEYGFISNDLSCSLYQKHRLQMATDMIEEAAEVAGVDILLNTRKSSVQ